MPAVHGCIAGIGSGSGSDNGKSETGDSSGSDGPTPAYLVESHITFQGSALSRHNDDADDKAPAELSTVESTIASGLRHSLRTIAEAQTLLRLNKQWEDWSPAAREQRNNLAGCKKLGL